MPDSEGRIWSVSALVRAVADALEARFNPVSVRGEISAFSRAASGHCYFSLKDSTGQVRCAMFKRAAGLLDFSPRDGELVELRGRLAIYEPRGDLQLIVESMTRAGQGTLFEQFLQRKAKLEALGLFDAQRKRALPAMPRAIGLVTSLGAAALHDVATALKRRVPHIPVVIAPASVQGAQAPAELQLALQSLYQRCEDQQGSAGDFPAKTAPIDVILLVRGGGSLDDLWAFNDEALVHTIAQSPVPVVCGVGHETDFTLADFVADLRAPTPTAAAELVAQPHSVWLGALDLAQDKLTRALQRTLDVQAQRLDAAAQRLGRPSGLVAREHQALQASAQRLRFAVQSRCRDAQREVSSLTQNWPLQVRHYLNQQHERLARVELKLGLLDPALVLERGYVWLSDAQGHTLTSAQQAHAGQAVQATLKDGVLDLQVQAVNLQLEQPE
jgi:exodeoxyribonuclease VII large subunit